MGSFYDRNIKRNPQKSVGNKLGFYVAWALIQTVTHRLMSQSEVTESCSRILQRLSEAFLPD